MMGRFAISLLATELKSVRRTSMIGVGHDTHRFCALPAACDVNRDGLPYRHLTFELAGIKRLVCAYLVHARLKRGSPVNAAFIRRRFADDIVS